MFTKEEVKEFLIKFGKRWLFPDFSNKLTWYVVTLGAGVILTPTPMKVVLYNWLVDSFNLNAGEHVTLADVASGSADYWIGFSLILVALLHNVFSKWLVLQESHSIKQEKTQIEEADRKLFHEFLQVFPSRSRSLNLLQQHDFGNSFNLDSLKEIDGFVNHWNCAEKKFMNEELEAERESLWKKCHEFSRLIAEKSAPTHGGFQSVVPDQYKHDWDWPDWVEKDVKKVNAMASEVADMHQKFIGTAKRLLKC